jgi:hypothetical protein
MKQDRIIVGALGVLVSLCAACTGSDSGGSAQPGVPSFPSSPSAPGSSSAPATASEVPPVTPPQQPGQPEQPGQTAAPAPAEPADPGECRSNELRLSLGRAEGAAGTVYRPLQFTNAGSRTCVIQGFPGVSYVAGDDGHQVGPAAVRDGTKGGPISLVPGATANAPLALVQVRNFDPAVCQPTPVRGLRVYPPHETASMFVAMDGVGCAGTPPIPQLRVQTMQSGAGV